MTPEAYLRDLACADTSGGPVELMRLCLFDWAVCAIAGQEEPAASILAMACDSEGEASVVGGGRTTPAEAALINGTTGHALDYDDTHFGHIGHTSAVVMPALLALAEEREANLSDLLDAALIGSEAALRVGLWLGRSHYQAGFHQTATSGAVGAALGGARLLGLDPGATGHAVGLAAAGAAGLKGQFGTMGKPLNAGRAARGAVEAALWAEAGMTSDPAGLSGPQGLGATHHGAGDATAFDGPDWQIAGLSHKFHACCHGLHAMLEALRDVPSDTVALTVTTNPRWLSVCNQPAPETGLAVKFSYRHTAAMALAGRDTGDIREYTGATARDPALCALREAVTVEASDSLSETQCRLTLTRASGETVTRSHDLAQPMAMEARTTRLRDKARTVLGPAKARDLWEATSGSDLAAVMAVLRS